uniref:PRC-barrel domain-containing protein n=1 Tax=Paractinoplanes polyasparticus TaxID=2856853 RepID=UPI001C854733|nr:PRC-barrel domain-containing protein [Actinoplanes polyasparticus]
MTSEFGTLTRLSDSSHLLLDPRQDIRGRKVVDQDGHEIGKVEDLLIDPEQQKVRLLRVEHGGLFGVGATPLYVPANMVERGTQDEVIIDRSRVQIAGAPGYDPDLIDGDKHFSELYEYYATTPYRGPGSAARNGRIFR